MKKSVSHISPLSAAKVAAAIYGIIGLAFSAIFSLFIVWGIFTGADFIPSMAAIVFLIVAPITQAVIGAIFVALVVWLYNVTAQWTGGLTITLEEPVSSMQNTGSEE